MFLSLVVSRLFARGMGLKSPLEARRLDDPQ